MSGLKREWVGEKDEEQSGWVYHHITCVRGRGREREGVGGWVGGWEKKRERTTEQKRAESISVVIWVETGRGREEKGLFWREEEDKHESLYPTYFWRQGEGSPWVGGWVGGWMTRLSYILTQF